MGSEEDPTTGWRLPWQAIAVAIVLAVGFVYQQLTAAERDESGQVVEAGDVSVEEFMIGDCLEMPNPEEEFEFETLRALPCDEPHDVEIYAIEDHGAAQYPGNEAMIAFAERTCLDAYRDFTGVSYEDEVRFDFSFSVPIDGTGWELGDREAVCYLHSLHGKPLTGSQADGGLLGVWALELGNCYRESSTVDYDGYSVVDCAEPHDFELFATPSLEPEVVVDFPGETRMDEIAIEACERAYLTHVGQPADDNDYGYRWERGVPEVYCYLLDR